MKIGRAVFLSVLGIHLISGTGASKPAALRETAAITCFQGMNEKVLLRSTDRLREASGDARVERKGGTTELDVDLDSMKPASLFGGDYNTYVLWVVPPEGPAENLGEIALVGSRGKLHASTAATTFAVLVTAEPHYLVSVPSAFVVLENKPNRRGHDIQYPVLEGLYNFERNNLDDLKEAKGKVHTEVRQAFTAVRLAQRAGATGSANDELAEAQHALDRTLKLWRQRADNNEIAAQARETVRLAVAAQTLAQDRAFQRARVEGEGSGGGNGESGRRDLRGRKIR
jgi:hypothetical protein